jgi:hypothetical protein
LNLILNCIQEKNRGTSSIQLNFLIHQLTVYTSVVDTGGKFATGVNYTGGKFATGIKDSKPVSTIPAAIE